VQLADTVVTRPALWLLGHGVAASPSPAMQNAALRARGLDWEYAIRDVSAAELPDALRALRDGVARGANVTIPHKRAVAEACDELVGDALLTGAVNTVTVGEGGRLVGDNTDALGLEGALKTLGLWPDAALAVVVLGAGGAAAAAALALSRAAEAFSDPSVSQVVIPEIFLVARRPDAAGKLLTSRPHVPGLRTAAWSPDAVAAALHSGMSSVLINATPAPLADLPIDVAALPDDCIVVDLRYRPRPVDLVAAAQARGLRAADGLEMLLHQGMLSFERWTGLEPPWDAARQALRDAVAAP